MENFSLAIHPNFRLNSKHYSTSELCQLAKTYLIAEEEYKKKLGTFLLEWCNENSFITLQTSGTTGAPKVIQLKKMAMVNSALATARYFNLQQDTTALHCLPTEYIAGKMMLVRALVCGWHLDVIQPDSNPLLHIEKEYDFAAMVPLQVENSIDKLYKIKQIIVGGAKLSLTLASKLKNTKSLLYETYGMTETITHVAVKNVKDSVFMALPNVFFSVDERGCLKITAPGILEEEIVTNDVVELINPTEFIWKGRFDNVVNSGGIKLFPEQIEEKLSGKFSCRFFMAAKPDEILGEKLVLVIESRPFVVDTTIFENLEKFERPREILFNPKFVETDTGKIKRSASIP